MSIEVSPIWEIPRQRLLLCHRGKPLLRITSGGVSFIVRVSWRGEIRTCFGQNLSLGVKKRAMLEALGRSEKEICDILRPVVESLKPWERSKAARLRSMGVGAGLHNGTNPPFRPNVD